MLADVLDVAFGRSPWVTVGLLSAGLLVAYLVRWGLQERKIRALGGHAPIKHGVPFGVDFVVRGLLAGFKHRNMELWQANFRDYDCHTIEIHPGGRRVIFTEDAENIKAILATQFQDFGKGEPFRQEWHDFLGDSIFTTDLDQWHSSRQLLRPLFIKDRVSDLQTFETHVDKLLRKIGGQGRTVDISALLFRYTLDAATDYLLGSSVGSLDDPQVEFAEAFAEVQRVQSIITRSGPMNVLVPRRRFRRNITVIDDFVNPYIEQALRLSPEELEKKTKADEGYTFLHALASFTRDRKVLRDQLIAVLLAGRDTTAATLSWTFYELSRHPEVVLKLRREILERLGRDRTPTYEDLKSMRYLQHTISETLRLYPAVPFNVRLALHDTTLPRGGGPDGSLPVGILKDTPIGYSALTMQRRDDLYPPPSARFAPHLEFSPDRWDGWTPKSWQYVPFNGGPRICIGQQFALTEMGYTIVRMLQRFERVEAREPGLDMPRRADIVLQPALPLNVAFYPEEGVDKPWAENIVY